MNVLHRYYGIICEEITFQHFDRWMDGWWMRFKNGIYSYEMLLKRTIELSKQTSTINVLKWVDSDCRRIKERYCHAMAHDFSRAGSPRTETARWNKWEISAYFRRKLYYFVTGVVESNLSGQPRTTSVCENVAVNNDITTSECNSFSFQRNSFCTYTAHTDL